MENGTLTISIVFFLLQLLQCVFCFVNLSVNKTADMSTSQYSDKWTADEAVDGDVSQKLAQGSCAVTSDNFHKQVWWRVDLGDVYVLNSVKIYYRKSDDRFSIYVADTLNWWIGTRCYLHNNGQHKIPGPSDILTVPCNATGRYVTVYKQRNGSCVWSPHSLHKVSCAKLELCEVQVQSCEDGTYGESCSNNCSGNCLYGVHCNKAHGGCDGGCAPGYGGFNCHDECNTGTYGFNCSDKCGNCNDQTCNRINGTCPNGCAQGWKGIICNETCSNGTFGQDCKDSCSQHCNKTTICNHINGTCDGGCQAGWMNHNCNQTCPFGRYGVNCGYTCSLNCINSSTCRHDNGLCEGGCLEGWKGDRCNQPCGTGTFGRNCQETCFNCQNYTCNRTDGACQSQCIAGYNGTFCNITCNDGFYGHQCSRMCMSCTETCHHVTGRCLVYDKQTPEDDKDSVIVGTTVTSGMTITALSVALLRTCLRLRSQSPINRKNHTDTNTIQMEQVHVQMSNIDISTQDTGAGMNQEIVTEVRNKVIYEDLMSTNVDTNAYETLERNRAVTYTNTHLD